MLWKAGSHVKAIVSVPAVLELTSRPLGYMWVLGAGGSGGRHTQNTWQQASWRAPHHCGYLPWTAPTRKYGWHAYATGSYQAGVLDGYRTARYTSLRGASTAVGSSQLPRRIECSDHCRGQSYTVPMMVGLGQRRRLHRRVSQAAVPCTGRHCVRSVRAMQTGDIRLLWAGGA